MLIIATTVINAGDCGELDGHKPINDQSEV